MKKSQFLTAIIESIIAFSVIVFVVLLGIILF